MLETVIVDKPLKNLDKIKKITIERETIDVFGASSVFDIEFDLTKAYVYEKITQKIYPIPEKMHIYKPIIRQKTLRNKRYDESEILEIVNMFIDRRNYNEFVSCKEGKVRECVYVERVKTTTVEPKKKPEVKVTKYTAERAKKDLERFLKEWKPDSKV